jgi:hypothetical protein
MDLSKRILFGIFFVAQILITTGAQAANCISASDMNEIAKKFTQFQNLAGKEYCYDDSSTSRLLAGIMFMRQTKFASSMPASPDDMFSGRFGSDWWTYFTGRINKFNVQSSCPKGAGAFVQPTFGGKTMFVCPLMLSDAFSALDSASVYMHEARHIDGFPHTTCTNGPRKGLQGACDTRIKDGGSYAVTVETYAQIARYAENVHPAMKAYSKSSALVYAFEAFENPVNIQFSPDFVVLTKNLEFHQIEANGPMKITTLGTAPHLGQIMIRRDFYVLFPDDKNLPASYVFTKGEGELKQSPGADAVEYNGQTPAEKAQLVGIHYGGMWSAKVTLDKVRFVCDPYGSGAKVEQALPAGTPVSLIYPNGYDKLSMTAYVQMDNGQIVEFGCRDKKTPYVQLAKLQYDQVYKRIYKSGSTTLGLTFDGYLYNIKNGSSTIVQTPFDGQIHELIANKTYTFFDL